jgi:Flp pilus assembly protein CpaB
MTYRARNIVVAVALAVLAALLTGFYVTGYKSHVRQQEQHVGVLVASHDIPVGMTGAEAVSHHYVAEQQVLQRTVVPGAFSHTSDVSELVATQPMFKGEQVTSARFHPPSQTGIRAELKGTLRAMQISGDPNQVLAGVLRAGDHVDVVATVRVSEDKPAVTRIVLRDLKVLRAPPTPSGTSRLDPSGSLSLILAARDTQVQKLLYAEKVAANWKLELRPVSDAADSPESLEWWWTMIKDAAGPNEVRGINLNPNRK